MKQKLLLLLLVAAYVIYTTVLLYLSPALAPYNQSFKGFFVVAFIMGVVLVVGIPFSGRPLDTDTKLVFLLYILFALYTLGLAFVSEEPVRAVIESGKYYMRIAFFFALVIWVNNLRDRAWVVGFPIVFGLAFAIQSLLLLGLLFAGAPLQQREVYIFEAFGADYPSYGLLGLANSMDLSLRTPLSVRVQSFFIEPSKFALFLIHPIFVAYGIYRVQRLRRFLVYAVVMLLAFLATWSLGGLVAFGGSVLVLAYFRFRRAIPLGLRWTVLVLSFVSLVLLGRAIFEFSLNYVPEDPTDKFAARVPGFAQGVSFEERSRTDAVGLEIFLQHPFGLSLINAYDSRILDFGDLASPNAALYNLVHTGLVGMLLQALIFWVVLTRFMIPQLRHECLGRYVSVAAVGVWTHSLSYGTWLDLNFFYTWAVVIALRDEVWPPRLADERVPAAGAHAVRSEA